ncbi:hypothetical protein Nepgr_006932 [Nepenthes gracilis]|uniref:Beta-Casp domain-containing protein n=1 Tax=Nepenthes gracilis TaxID=150966 RepID=A0AAD3S5X8_NEPGR|nr:hypothetical protein Nepgr_006932 [Nepenthes gracilis]
MVQRNVPAKLGISAGESKTDKWPANVKPSLQNHDGKNKGTDLKKTTMKKSRSFKRSDYESLNPTRRFEAPKLEKPPPPGSPNYMKSTSSSEARKEQKQLSTPNPSVSSGNNRTPCHRISKTSGSKLHSCSALKPSRTVSRTSSFKRVRSFTKTLSFKPARSSANKCSKKVAVCAKLRGQKATCSSTLKDSKFPPYLTLNPGGTESQGTSAMKVCPYTYCSLNGHHRSPVPPLKCFLSARRQVLKIQKIMKLEALSSHKDKPLDADSLKQADPALMITNDISAAPDFFIEIYVQNRDDKTEAGGESSGGDRDDLGEEKENPHQTVPSAGSVDGEAALEHEYEEITTSLSDELHSQQVDFGDNLERNKKMPSEMNFMKNFEKASKEDNPPMRAQVKDISECFYGGSDFELGSTAGNSMDEIFAETSDMEWEEGQLSDTQLDNDDDNSSESNKKYDQNIWGLSGNEVPHSHGEFILTPADVPGNFFKEIQADEVLPDLHEETTESRELYSDSDSFPSDSECQNMESSQSNESPGDCTCSVNSSASSNQQLKDSVTIQEEMNCTSEPENEILNGDSLIRDDATVSTENETSVHEQERELFYGIDANSLTTIKISDSYHGSAGTNCENEGNHRSCEIIEVYHLGISIQGKGSSEDTLEIMPLKIGELEMDANDTPKTDTGSLTEEKEQIDVTKLLTAMKVELNEAGDDAARGVRIFAICQQADDDSNHAQVQDDSCSDHSERTNSADNGQGSKKHQHDNKIIPEMVGSKEQSDSIMQKPCFCEEYAEAVKATVQNDIAIPDAVEISPSLRIEMNLSKDNTSFHEGSHIGQEFPGTCSTLRRTTRCKRPVKDSEEPRTFNPREPNFLPVEPDPEAETVDLRHQEMDERKNAEEWMVDYALQQAVNKFTPARKKKSHAGLQLIVIVKLISKGMKIAILVAITSSGSAKYQSSQVNTLGKCVQSFAVVRLPAKYGEVLSTNWTDLCKSLLLISIWILLVVNQWFRGFSNFHASMKLTCLSKGGPYYFPPCHIIDICGFRVLLDCPLDLSVLSIFSPVPTKSNWSLQELLDRGFHESSDSDSMDQKRQKVDKPIDASSLVYSAPWYKTVNNLHLWNASFINVVLISSPMGMLGLPFLTHNKDFSAKIYATEATVRLGQLMMEDLVSMHREYKQFYGPEESGFPQWLRWEELEMLPPVLKERVLGKDGTQLGGWLPLYSAAAVKDCIQKVQSLKYAEEACYNGTLIIKAFSSGLDIGTCNWTIRGPKRDVAYVCTSVFDSGPAMNFDYKALQDHDIILYSDFSNLEGVEDSENDFNHSAPINKNAEGAFVETLLNSDESSQEADKLAFIVSCSIDSLKAGGSVLIPIGRLGVILQLLDQMALSQELLSLKVPIFIISSVSKELLSFTNIIPEWLSKLKQEKLFAGEPLFAHVDLLKQKRLHPLPTICSPDLVRLWQEPCIVFCPHWSLRLGPAVHFLRRWCRDDNSLLVLEKGMDSDLALLPFKPVSMKVLQCSFLSGLRSSKILTLLEKLRPKLALVPEDFTRLFASPNSNMFSFLKYSESETLHIPSLKYNSELEIAADLASQLHWRPLRQDDINITRLKGELLMDHGKQRLLLGNESTDTSQCRPLMHWGSLELESLLTALQNMGINGSVETVSGTSNRAYVLLVTEPSKALIEVGPTSTVISAADENLASLISEAVENILDGI